MSGDEVDAAKKSKEVDAANELAFKKVSTSWWKHGRSDKEGMY